MPLDERTIMRKLIVGLVLTLTGLALSTQTADALNKPNRKACAAIVAEFRRQGASAAVANRFGQIAWRESGCVVQHVIDRDDRSHSRLGLNFIGPMPRYWQRVCGVSNYHATANLRTDVKCALAAYRQLGWKPWR
jgi:hypothetical protein